MWFLKVAPFTLLVCVIAFFFPFCIPPPLIPLFSALPNPLENSAMVNYRGKEESSLILNTSSEPAEGDKEEIVQGETCRPPKRAMAFVYLYSSIETFPRALPFFKHTQTGPFRSTVGERATLAVGTVKEQLGIPCPPKGSWLRLKCNLWACVTQKRRQFATKPGIEMLSKPPPAPRNLPQVCRCEVLTLAIEEALCLVPLVKSEIEQKDQYICLYASPCDRVWHKIAAFDVEIKVHNLH